MTDLDKLIEAVEGGRLPDASLLHHLLDYDSENGTFKWKARDAKLFKSDRDAKAWNAQYAGRKALTTTVKGYMQGSLFGKHIYAHRAALAITNGKWPETVDHINGDKKDNRLENLRDVEFCVNLKNLPMTSRNTSGEVGISYIASRKKWHVSVGIGGGSCFIGYYDTERDALIARRAAAKAVGYHDNHGRKQQC